MKSIFSFFFSMVCLGTVYAQGTLQFAVHLTGATDATGDGTFSLTGNLLSYDLLIPYLFTYNTAEIHGPGVPGLNAPLIFGLHVRSCQPPQDLYKGGCLFQGNLTLTDAQIPELVAEQWYVKAYWPELPDLPLQGQILQVPEPCTGAVLGLAAGVFWLLSNLRRLLVG